MRKMMRVFSVVVLAAVGVLTACGPVEASTESPVEALDARTDSLQGLEQPAGAKETPPVDLNSCYTTTCTPGAAGDAYCTSLCGDVAKCFSSGFGCGSRPCCVMM
jgi:hypothetical protein